MRIFRRNKKENVLEKVFVKKREKKIGAFPFSSWYGADSALTALAFGLVGAGGNAWTR